MDAEHAPVPQVPDDFIRRSGIRAPCTQDFGFVSLEQGERPDPRSASRNFTLQLYAVKAAEVNKRIPSAQRPV